jgi:hypothetical protein
VKQSPYQTQSFPQLGEFAGCFRRLNDGTACGGGSGFATAKDTYSDSGVKSRANCSSNLYTVLVSILLLFGHRQGIGTKFALEKPARIGLIRRIISNVCVEIEIVLVADGIVLQEASDAGAVDARAVVVAA